MGCHGWEKCCGGTGLPWALKAEEPGWDGQRGQGKVFQAVWGHRISEGHMAGRRVVDF